MKGKKKLSSKASSWLILDDPIFYLFMALISLEDQPVG